MPIEFSCNSCQKLLRVPDGTEGRTCQCAACGQISVVPDLRKPTAPSIEEVDDGLIRVTCPKCQYPLRCKAELKGTKGQCKQCKHIFIIGDTKPVSEDTPTLVFDCPKCQQLFDGKPEMEGRKGKCHSCGEVFKIKLRQAASNKKKPESSAKLDPSQAIREAKQVDLFASQGGSAISSSTKEPAAAKHAPNQTISSSTDKLQIVCGNCQKSIQAPSDAKGKQITCPHCSTLLQIPGKSSVPDSKPARQSVFDLPEEDIFPAQPNPSTSSPFDFGNEPSLAAIPSPLPYLPVAPYPPSNFGQPTGGYPASSYPSPYATPTTTAMSGGYAASGMSRQQLRSIAIWLKQLMIWFMVAFFVPLALLVILSIVFVLFESQAPSFAVGIGILILLGILLTFIAGILFFVSYCLLSVKVLGSNTGLWYIIGYFVPVLSLVLLIKLLIQTRALLRSHGVRVGLFGADASSI